MKLRIGTRGSKLALAQSEWVREQIRGRYSDVEVKLIRIKTKGDKILDSPLSEVGGKGLFVKEIEEALLKKDVDVAVHSMKDVPTQIPEGLYLPIFPKREDPRDVFVSQNYPSFDEMPQGALVGTSSLRRSAQLLNRRPDIRIVSLRGNVDTRLKKLQSGQIHAVILAKAGLGRLGLTDRISQVFPLEQLLPAVGQGALGLEMRKDDDRIHDLLRFLNHRPTAAVVRAERAFLKTLEGGCQVPIAAHGRLNGSRLVLRGLVAELDGSKLIQDEISGEEEQAEELGTTLARQLLSSGAKAILDRIYRKS